MNLTRCSVLSLWPSASTRTSSPHASPPRTQGTPFCFHIALPAFSSPYFQPTPLFSYDVQCSSRLLQEIGQEEWTGDCSHVVVCVSFPALPSPSSPAPDVLERYTVDVGFGNTASTIAPLSPSFLVPFPLARSKDEFRTHLDPFYFCAQPLGSVATAL